MIPVSVRGLFIGKTVPFGPGGTPSAIAKKPVVGPVRLGRTGLAGDECGDPRFHGGPEKALHQYPFDHYAFWRETLPDAPHTFAHGPLFGENVSSCGMTEENVCIGDVFRLGSALIEVSQARQPCWKLNVRFEHPSMARMVQDSGRTGWYYRVLEEGEIAPDSTFQLMERPHPDWTLARLLHGFYQTPLERAFLEAAVALGVLSPSWKNTLAQRLASGRVEDWDRRLQTPVSA